MPTYAGWEGVLELESDPVKEVLDASATAGTNKHYYTAHYPVVDSATRVVTDDAADIIVYKNDVALTPTTDYTLDGSEGDILIGSVSNADKITVSYAAKQTVGSWRSITIGSKNNIKRVQVGGTREALELKEMLLEQDIKFEQVLLDARALKEGMAWTEDPIPKLPEMIFRAQTASTGGVEVEGYCKLDSTKLTIKHDDITGVEVDAIARALVITAT